MRIFSSLQRSKQAILYGCIGFFLIGLLFNLAHFGGREFISAFNTLTMIVFWSLAALQALMYWRSMQNREEASRVWLVLGLGLVFYDLGNIVWFFYNLAGIEAPYPSLGDFFWLFAYPLIAIALINKNMLLGVLPTRKQIALVFAPGLALLVAIGYFIFVPMLDDAGTARAAETALNFFYPIIDFIILIAASFLVIVLWRGRLSLTWNVIAAGVLVLSFSDVLFTYGTWNDLYYAEGAINLLTKITDIGYNLASLLVAIGIYIQALAVSVEPAALEFEFTRSVTSAAAPPPILPFTSEVEPLFEKMFFMVDHDLRVFFFSNGYRDLHKLAGGNQSLQWGAPFHLACGVEESVARDMFAAIQRQGSVVVPADLTVGQYRIPVTLQARIARKGADVFLRYRQENAATALEEKPAIAATLIEETLCSVADIKDAAPELRETIAFFVIEVQELYIFLVQMGGVRLGQVLAQKFNRMANAGYAGVSLSDGRVILTGVLSYGMMNSLLHLTMKTVQEFTSAEAAQEVIKQLNARVPENIIHSAQNAGLVV